MKNEKVNLKSSEVKIKNDYGYLLTIFDPDNLLTESIIERLKRYNAVFYFKDIIAEYWIFDFKIEDVWFEAKKIVFGEKALTLKCFK